MERSDKYSVQINDSSGLIDYTSDTSKHTINVPYAFKLLIQELQCMSINPRLIVTDEVDNPEVFKYLASNISR